MRLVMRRSRRPVDIVKHNTGAVRSVNSKRAEYERTRKAINQTNQYMFSNVGGAEQQQTLDTIGRNNVFKNDQEAYAEYLLNHCVDEIRSMYTMDAPDTRACQHERQIEDTASGCDVCTDCGELFARVLFDTSGMDGILQGTHSVQTPHMYKRKTYFLGHMRNLFGQTRCRPAPWMIVLWAQGQTVASGSAMLSCMKRAPKRIRHALNLAKYYKYAHTIFRDAHERGHRVTELRADDEDLIMHMYDGCLNAFVCVREQHGRSSFPNRYYVMYQLMRLAGMTDGVLSMVPRMRMESKNREHDHMWSDICKVQGWAPYFLAEHDHTCTCHEP